MSGMFQLMEENYRNWVSQILCLKVGQTRCLRYLKVWHRDFVKEPGGSNVPDTDKSNVYFISAPQNLPKKCKRKTNTTNRFHGTSTERDLLCRTSWCSTKGTKLGDVVDVNTHYRCIKEQDNKCKVRQLRIQILHFLTMQLGDTEFAKILELLKSLLQNRSGNKQSPIFLQILLESKQHERNDFATTTQDEDTALRMVQKSIHERMLDLLQIYEIIVLLYIAVPSGCPLQEKNSTRLKKMAQDVIRLFCELQHTEQTLADIYDLRKHMVKEDLENVRTQNRRQICVIHEKEGGPIYIVDELSELTLVSTVGNNQQSDASKVKEILLDTGKLKIHFIIQNKVYGTLLVTKCIPFDEIVLLTVDYQMKCDLKTFHLQNYSECKWTVCDLFCSQDLNVKSIKKVKTTPQSNTFTTLDGFIEYPLGLVYKPIEDHCLEITVMELNHLFVSLLNDCVINPMKIFNAWLNRLTHRSVEGKTLDCRNDGRDMQSLLMMNWNSGDEGNFDSDANTIDIRCNDVESIDVHGNECNDSLTVPQEPCNSLDHQLNVNLCDNSDSVPKDINLKLYNQTTSKPLCKKSYGTVNLKNGQNVEQTPFVPIKDDISESENDDKEKNLIKQVIKGNGIVPISCPTMTVAPILKGKSKKKKSDDNTDSSNQSATGNVPPEANEQSVASTDKTKNINSNRNALDNTGTLRSIDTDRSESFTQRLRQNTSLETKANEELKDEQNGACASKTDTCSSKRHVDQISIDGHKPLRTEDVQIDTSTVGKCGLSKDVAAFQVINAENHCSGNGIKSRSTYSKETCDAPSNRPKHNQESLTDSADDARHMNGNRNTDSPIHSAITHTSNESFPNPAVEQSDIQAFEPLMRIIDKIAIGERVPPQITMQYEMLRFCTLRSYPKENKPFITRIAQAGFYYANSSDELVCYCCGRRKSSWQETDIPMDVHRQLNPNCKFFTRNSEVNVPIKTVVQTTSLRVANVDSTSHISNMITSALQSNIPNQSDQNGCRTDTNSTGNISQHAVRNSSQLANSPNTASDVSNTTALLRDAVVSSLQRSNAADDTQSRMQSRAHGNFVQASTPSSVDDGRRQHAATSNKAFEPIYSGCGRTTSQAAGEESGQNAMPKYPKYASKTIRITSFSDCNDIVVSPESLAEAGFLYAGFGDCVRCFFCGVGLRHWSQEDDPWIEHSRWSKQCSYVKQMRGQEFVNLVEMAVQYSQNQNGRENSDQRQSEDIPGSNEGRNGGDEVENLLHTDAAQSVLEMGYHPDLIRRAIGTVLEVNGRQNLTAVNLMENILQIEDAENPISTEQNREVFVQNHQLALSTAPVNQQSETSESNREVVGTGSGNSHPHGLTDTQSRRNDEIPSASAHSASREMTRVSKKSQILEQKKLKEENQKLKQQSICTKCNQNDVCIVFLPCGHLVTCETCAPTVRYCTVQSCGKYIKGTVRTYLA